MKKKNKLYNKIYNALIGIIIFLVPSNFFLKFFESEAYVNGLMVDYLIPKLYLSDVFILGLLIVWLSSWLTSSAFKKRKYWKNIRSLFKKPKSRIVVAIITIFFLRQFWTSHPTSSIVYLLRVVELGFFARFLIKNKKIISKNLIEKAVLATLFFQSSVAIYQYINQKSLFGYLLIGEPSLSNYIGISKSTLFGAEKILPYGTTAHPNVLGGFLALYLLYILNKVKWKTKLKNSINTQNLIVFSIVFAATTVLFLTQSISAIITFILGLGLIVNKKYSKKATLKNIIFLTFGLIFLSIISLSMLAEKYPESQSISRRNYLNTAALNMVRSNILTGVGLNNFTANVEKFSKSREVVRFVQPTHNIFLLLIAETGLLGLAVLGVMINLFRNHNQRQKNSKIFLLFKRFKKNKKDWRWILVILPIALLDHYFLTLNAGLLLLTFLVSLT